MKRGERLRLHLDALAFGGDAVARAADGRVVFVLAGAPGDEVIAAVSEARRDFLRATIVEVVAPGAARVTPRCPLVGSCGGCQWQQVALAAQQAAKQAIVERALHRLGVPIDPLRIPSEPFGYRTRARFTIGESGAIGFQQLRAHSVIDVGACPLLEPALDRALGAARAALAGRMIAGGTIAGLGGRGGLVHLALEGVRPEGGGAARDLIGRAGIIGAIVDGEVVGAPAIDTALGDEPPFFSSAAGFAQAGPSGNRALRGLVAELVGSDAGHALELYAGDGNLTRDLAARARSVLAVEGDGAAVARLRRNVPSVEALAEPVEQAAARLAAAGRRFDVALIDPPRAGARPLLPSLAKLADRLIYVSCDPMTLARDARELAALGLAPRRAAAIDMMPQTFHVETVVLFSRS